MPRNRARMPQERVLLRLILHSLAMMRGEQLATNRAKPNNGKQRLAARDPEVLTPASRLTLVADSKNRRKDIAKRRVELDLALCLESDMRKLFVIVLAIALAGCADPLAYKPGDSRETTERKAHIAQANYYRQFGPFAIQPGDSRETAEAKTRALPPE